MTLRMSRGADMEGYKGPPDGYFNPDCLPQHKKASPVDKIEVYRDDKGVIVASPYFDTVTVNVFKFFLTPAEARTYAGYMIRAAEILEYKKEHPNG
jgi:hypothetical protein